MDPRAPKSVWEIATRLGAISDPNLRQLQATIDVAPNMLPGLLAWLEHAVDWELNRRKGFSHVLREPIEAIPDDEIASSTASLAILSARFRNDTSDGCQAIADFFDLVGAILSAGRKSTERLH